MALDEVLFFENQKEGSPPLFRIYGWERTAVSLGYFQKIEQACNLRECEKENLPVIRRITGGRAVYHHQDLTYCFMGGVQTYPELGKTVLETYRQTSQALLEGLKMLGVQAEWEKRKFTLKGQGSDLPCFASSSIYEVTYQGKKLIGSAQKRVGSWFIQQGSMPLDSQTTRQKIFLTNGNYSDSGFEKKFTGLAEILNRQINLKDVADIFKTAWEKFWNVKLEEISLSPEVIDHARELVELKYHQKSWNLWR